MVYHQLDGEVEQLRLDPVVIEPETIFIQVSLAVFPADGMMDSFNPALQTTGKPFNPLK